MGESPQPPSSSSNITAYAPKYELAAEQTDYEECLACQ